MKKWSICRLVVILTTLTSNDALAQFELIKTTQLNSFPSASSLTYYNNHLYALGDDAPDLLILNKDHKVIKKVRLFNSKSKRIDKASKADLEASAQYVYKNTSYLVGFSSFSLQNRNKILLYNFSKPAAPSNIRLISKEDPLKGLPIKETNIEGAAFVEDKLLLSNRANNTHRTNHIVVTGFDLKYGIITKDATVISLEIPGIKNVAGISGLEYVKEKDLLLFVASTENTASATADGSIGDSFIGYIRNISRKLDQKQITVDTITSLNKLNKQQRVYKIESVALESVNDNELIIHLAADNDDGQSTLFKAKWNIKE